MFALKKCVFLRDNAFSVGFARFFHATRMKKDCLRSPCLQYRKANLVNVFFLSAQRVNGAFAIVKAARRESLGIIKTA